MTQSIVQDRTARRVSKATGIVERHEVIPCDDRPGYFNVRDTGTGSGRVYLASATSCTCPDHVYRGHTCKHQIAAVAEEQALAQYCADWNARVEQARAAAGPQCPECGGRLTSQTFYIGGKGYQAFLVCTRDAQHRALPA